MAAEIDAAVSCEFGGNFKSLLQQLAQREHGVTPGYLLLDEKGPDHSKCFKVAAQIGPRRFAAAWGKSKKESEQRAAHNAINQLRGEPEPYPSDEAATDELAVAPTPIRTTEFGAHGRIASNCIDAVALAPQAVTLKSRPIPLVGCR